jgi:hypothetical protein
LCRCLLTRRVEIGTGAMIRKVRETRPIQVASSIVEVA